MPRILPGIASLKQHLEHLDRHPEAYRPDGCPHCGKAGSWSHGHYWRKADWIGTDGKYLEPIPIPRFYCPHCRRTCSRLPACIAPRRWYPWVLQQAVLVLLLAGHSIRAVSRQQRASRHTVSRWWRCLKTRHLEYTFHLRSRFPFLGRHASVNAFWSACFDRISLTEAMGWLDRDGIAIP